MLGDWGISAQQPATQPPDGAELMAKARAFLADSGVVVMSVRSLEVRGTAMRLAMSSSGERAIPQSVVMRFELPDKYLRIDRRDALAITLRTGLVNGRVVYQANAENPGDQAVAKAAPDEARSQQENFARHLLALLMRDTPSFPLKYEFLGAAQAASGTAHAVRAVGADGFSTEVFIDPLTHRPLMIRYTGLQLLPGRATSSTQSNALSGPPGSAAALAALRTPELTTWYLSDYRMVDGLRLPHRITKEAGGVTLEDLHIESFKVNPRFSANDFK
jgi:hypothetical protein